MKIFLAYALSLTLGLAVAACQTAAPHRPADANAQLNDFFGGANGLQGPAPNPGRSAQGGEDAGAQALRLAWDDPCAANLDQINGALLDYYIAHKSFPPALEAIPLVAPTGERISLSCPVSGKRYVYYPQGLRLPPAIDDQGRIQLGLVLILYDPEPSHYATAHQAGGKDVRKPVRIASVWDPRRESFDVIPLEQAVLDVYLRGAPPATTAPAVRPANGVW